MNSPIDRDLEDFRAVVSVADDEIDLARAALLVARVEYPELDVERELARLGELAERVAARMDAETGTIDRLETLNEILFREVGLRGAAQDYNDPDNSFIHRVLETKVGIPVSLSVIYMSVGARAGIPLGGTAMPLHFIVRALGLKPPRFVDCFNRGRMLTEEQCREGVERIAGARLKFEPSMTALTPNAEVIGRLITNLRVLYLNSLDYSRALPMLDRLVLLRPQDGRLLRERGLVRYRLGKGTLARQDLVAYLDSDSRAEDADRIRKLLREIK